MKPNIQVYYVAFKHSFNSKYGKLAARILHASKLQKHINILTLTQIISKLVGFFSKNIFFQSWKLDDSELTKEQNNKNPNM